MERKSAEEIAEIILGQVWTSRESREWHKTRTIGALESYANSRLEAAAQIFESLPPDGGRVKVEVVIASIRSLKSKEAV